MYQSFANVVNVMEDEKRVEYPDHQLQRAFDYRNIQQCKTDKQVIACQDYEAFHERFLGDGFIMMQDTRPAIDEATRQARNVRKGYKLHISLKDDRDGNLERGWDIIVAELIRHRVCFFKIIADDMRAQLAADEEQRGKAITIYAFREIRSTPAWQQLIQDITQALANEGVIPGALPDSDEPIPGCNYVSYRNDGRQNLPNPFDGIQIAVANQPDRNASSERCCRGLCAMM